ncbi:GTP cyclohydrolase II [uncultured Thermanaerothrix sp.]|uniref:GTP cyclohydrolase II n=1 Tax=uncultured Thermanaerothrix sp. TaxID=1195149 RepID=UPI00261EEF91|nr:GTP cyclohydrolase II [uncultured Thermanaerothrix sp.]
MGNLEVKCEVSTTLPTAWGRFRLHLYTDSVEHREHLVLVRGDLDPLSAVLTRVHSECFTGDVLGSRRCDCGEQLQQALSHIANSRQGILIYLRQEGRGIGLREKLRAYNLQDQGLDTVEANLALGHPVDARRYDIAALILKDLGISRVRLMTNNPQKIHDLEALGIQVVERVPLLPTVYPENMAYLRSKVLRLNHWLDLGELPYASSKHPGGNGQEPHP